MLWSELFQNPLLPSRYLQDFQSSELQGIIKIVLGSGGSVGCFPRCVMFDRFPQLLAGALIPFALS